MPSIKNTPSTYAESGVDISAEKTDIDILSKWTKKTFEFGNVLAKFGHYANLIEFGDYALALTTDGVGSKILLAQIADKYDTIGIDCVAMNVNDLLAMGIKPIGFVDYLAIEGPLGSLTEPIAKGLYEGCKQSMMPLLGGELATLPDIIKGVKRPGFDLAGTAMGVVKKDKIITGERIKPGDVVLGLPSSGLHSNGFTLARKLIKANNLTNSIVFGNKTWIEELLIPTTIYVKEILDLVENLDVLGLAHITGGGFTKLKRLTDFGFNLNNFPDILPIFKELQKLGNISNEEMAKTYNLGIGFVIVVAKENVAKAKQILNKYRDAFVLGEIVETGKITISSLGVTL